MRYCIAHISDGKRFTLLAYLVRDLLKFNDHKSVIIIKDISTTFEF